MMNVNGIESYLMFSIYIELFKKKRLIAIKQRYHLRRFHTSLFEKR